MKESTILKDEKMIQIHRSFQTLLTILFLLFLVYLSKEVVANDDSITNTSSSWNEHDDDDEAFMKDLYFTLTISMFLRSLWMEDLKRFLKCHDIPLDGRPIYSDLEWMQARHWYRTIVGAEEEEEKYGFHVPFEVRQMEGKGRGIFATSDIEEGMLIWNAVNRLDFYDGTDYKKFLFGLDRGFACDVLIWAYVHYFDGELIISVDMDAGSFCNDGGWDANMGCYISFAQDVEGGCRDNFFALEDVKAGDEILCDYESFAHIGGWDEFDEFY